MSAPLSGLPEAWSSPALCSKVNKPISFTESDAYISFATTNSQCFCTISCSSEFRFDAAERFCHLPSARADVSVCRTQESANRLVCACVFRHAYLAVVLFGVEKTCFNRHPSIALVL